jgi:hypothetical protein
MSWYNRKPRIKEPPKLVVHHTSPIAEKMLDEAKKLGPKSKQVKTKSINKK